MEIREKEVVRERGGFIWYGLVLCFPFYSMEKPRSKGI